MSLSLIINFQKNVDLFSFFEKESSIICPDSLWFECFVASLKMKHGILILESEIAEVPKWEQAKRWDQGTEWCWVAPRALSFILESRSTLYLSSYTRFKDHLSTCK